MSKPTINIVDGEVYLFNQVKIKKIYFLNHCEILAKTRIARLIFLPPIIKIYILKVPGRYNSSSLLGRTKAQQDQKTDIYVSSLLSSLTLCTENILSSAYDHLVVSCKLPLGSWVKGENTSFAPSVEQLHTFEASYTKRLSTC